MSLLLYCTLAFLPVFLVLYRIPVRWHFDAGERRRPAWTLGLLACYAAPYALIWTCAAGFFPAADRLLFSQQPQHWCRRLETALACPDSLLQCQYFKSFIYDNWTAVFLSLAAASWWVRDVDGLPRWFPKALAGLAYFMLMEETRYCPFAPFLNRDWGGGTFQLHAKYRTVVNGYFFCGGYAAVVKIWIYVIVAQWSARWSRVQAVISRLEAKAPVWWSQLRRLHIPHPMHLIFGFLLASKTDELLWVRDVFRYAEHDKYSDFGQGMAYMALFLISLEYPVRSASRSPAPRALFETAWIACAVIVGDILGRLLGWV